MDRVQEVQQQVERALAFAEQVLECASQRRIYEAMLYAESVLPRLANIKPAALGDARELVWRARELRAILTVLEQRASVRAPAAMN